MKEIPLTRNKVTLVDDKDYDFLMQWKWYVTNPYGNIWYASRCINIGGNRTRRIFMHREILKAKKGLECDHIDNNGLNNQRSNLRLVTHSQNMHNRKMLKNCKSGFFGVSWYAKLKKWRVSKMLNYKSYYGGVYNDIIQAGKASDSLTKELHGNYGKLNFPKETIYCPDRL